MATKLEVLRNVVLDITSKFPDLTPNQEVYLTPKIMIVNSMTTLEIQVCEGASTYEDIAGGCRSEDFTILVGIFRKYRLDSDGRHAKALADLNISLYKTKEEIIEILDGNFITPRELLTRPIIIKAESAVQDAGAGQLLKVISFTAGLNTEMGEDLT